MASSDAIAVAKESCFIEVIHQHSQKQRELPEWIDCFIATNIDRKMCEPLTRELNNWQRDFTARYGGPPPTSSVINSYTDFPRIDHLKRIRRRPATSYEIELRKKSEEAILLLLREEEEATAAAAVAGAGCISFVTEDTNNGEEGSNNESTTNTTNPGEPIREQYSTVSGKKRKNKKRSKPEDPSTGDGIAPWSLDCLIGSITAIDYFTQTASSPAAEATTTKRSDDLSTRLNSILERYNIHPHTSINIDVTRQKLPGRPAKTKAERQEWNTSLWPTLFFEEQTLLYKEEKMALTSEEINMMRLGMKEAIKDAVDGRQQWRQWRANTTCANEKMQQEMMASIVGAVVFNPQTCSIVSRASEERSLQGMPENGIKPKNSISTDTTDQSAKSWSSFPDESNPMLCTPVLLAIQGVSRNERNIAIGCGMDSTEFQGGQVRRCSECILYLLIVIVFGRFALIVSLLLNCSIFAQGESAVDNVDISGSSISVE